MKRSSLLEVVVLLIITWLALLQVAAAAKGGPKCNEKCGNLSIEYPFGIKEGCYLDKVFKVSCVDDVPTLPPAQDSTHTFTILEIILPNRVLLETSKIMAVDCVSGFNKSVSIKLPSPFTVSSWGNRFRALGCDTTAYINSTDDIKYSSQCDAQWQRRNPDKLFGGLGQCQIAVPEGSSEYKYNITNQYEYTKSVCARKCSYAFLVKERYEIATSVLDDYYKDNQPDVNGGINFPLVGEWVITDKNCTNNKSPTCGPNTWCNYTFTGDGYNCRCNDDRPGNPYIHGHGGCHKDFPTVAVAVACGIALAGTLAAGAYSHWSLARKKYSLILAGEIFQAALQIVQDDLIPIDETVPDDTDDPPKSEPGNEPMQYNPEDLKRGIRVLYRTGRTVCLWAGRRMVAIAKLRNNEVVEIRKYTVEDKDQLKNFMIGVRILCLRVRHRNVALLSGICTEDSSLIYRYFSNKTLHGCLHTSSTDWPSWEERLKIAVGAATGLSLAHSKGIYHGNVKSSNILLDEYCECKVVDFGVVRLWKRNKLLKSSKGYISPDYLNECRNRITSKMDVYSFGVVLVELITGKDPSAKVYRRRGNSLAIRFMLAVEEERLEEYVDPRIWSEERKAQLEAFAAVAILCLEEEPKERKDMSEIRIELLKIAPADGRRLVEMQRQLGEMRGQLGEIEGQIGGMQGQLGDMQHQISRLTPAEETHEISNDDEDDP